MTRQHASARVLPAREYFEADDPPVLQVDDGLVERDDAVPLEPFAQLVGEGGTLALGFHPVGVEEAPCGAAGFLDVRECRACRGQRFVRPGRLAGQQGHAEADRTFQRADAGGDRRAERALHGEGRGFSVRHTARRGHEQRELVGAQPGHHVRRGREGTQPVGDHAQDLIADAGAMAGVDRGEPVHIDQQQRAWRAGLKAAAQLVHEESAAADLGELIAAGGHEHVEIGLLTLCRIALAARRQVQHQRDAGQAGSGQHVDDQAACKAPLGDRVRLEPGNHRQHPS